MAPLDPRDPNDWTRLLAEWQQAQLQWAQWWQKSMGISPASAEVLPTTEEPTSPGAPLGAVEPFARFQSGCETLTRAALDLSRTGGRLPTIVETPVGDRRFKADAWHEQPYFSLLRQSYLLYAQYLHELAGNAPLPDAERQRLEFATRQYLDAIAPTNFPATNPEVLQKAVATEGASLVQGLRNLAEDAKRGRITMTDERAFEVGRNLATTPGSVVFRNNLIELIQYDPTTASVYSRPLLMVPPCINKYYILDLRSENSLVRHAVAKGHTVFMVSWRNIPPESGHLTWDDYIEQGVVTAIREAQQISGTKAINTLGFCVGGTLLASALAVLAARKISNVASVTFLTTMLDFADPGDIGVYVSREYLAAREPQLLAGQRVHGSELASAFASLRANELVWNYVVNNYLKGETPPAFDLLYWNGDSANLPGPMYVYYLRSMYLDNRLRDPNALTMAGTPVDLRRIKVPVYVYASRDDHIVPWRGAYSTTHLVGGDATFVLGASGHIAGVVNPPLPTKRNYWTNDRLADAPDEWLQHADTVPGSWWTHWDRWLARRGGPRREAPKTPGDRAHPPLAPAPGLYVLAKS